MATSVPELPPHHAGASPEDERCNHRRNLTERAFGAEQKAQGIGGTIRFGGKVQLKLPARAGLLRGSSCFPGGLQDPWSGLCPRAAVRGAPVTCQTTSQASERSLCLAKWKPSASLCGVPGCILIANPRNKTLRENVRGGGLMSSGAWFEGSASFVPFLCCFSAELVHTWGPHTSRFACGPDRLHPIANPGEVNLGTVDACGVHSRSQGSVDLLKLIVHKLVCV